MKDSTKGYATLAIAASTCIFLLHYTIPLLFRLVNWTFTQPLYVRAGVVSVIVGIAVFGMCVVLGRINND